MLKQYNIRQSLFKNNIILDQNDITMIEDTNPDKEYNCDKYIKSRGFTLLHKLVLLSGKYPEEVNKVNEKGWSALLLATINKSLKIVKLLLSHQSVGVEHNANIPAKRRYNVNIKDNYGLTALMYASSYPTESSPKIVKLLLEYNADVNIKDNDGWTALMNASFNTTESSPKIIKILLEYDSVPVKKTLCAVKNIEVLNAKN